MAWPTFSLANLRLFRVPLLALGVILTAFGVWGLATDFRYMTSGVPIRASVVGLTNAPGGKHRAILEYRVNDAIYEQISSANAGPHDIGAKKDLRYLREKPSSTRDSAWIWIDLLLCALGGALLAAYRALRKTATTPAAPARPRR